MSASPLFVRRVEADVVPLTDRFPRRQTGSATAWLDAQAAAAAVVRPLFGNSDERSSRGGQRAEPSPSAAEQARTGEQREREIDAELGRLEAERTQIRDARRGLEQARDRYLDGIAALAERAREAGTPRSEDVVALAMVVAREIIGHEAQLHGDVIKSALDQAFSSVRPGAGVTVRLSAEDAALVKARRPELVLAGVEFRVDAAMESGGCVVESAGDVVDASLNARLDAAAGALRTLFRETEATGESSPNKVRAA